MITFHTVVVRMTSENVVLCKIILKKYTWNAEYVHTTETCL